MQHPSNSFRTLAGIPVHYARPPVAPYGTRGEARRFLAVPSFERLLDAAFGELSERCPLGAPEVIVSAGAWVAKPGFHGRGRGFDLDALFWPGDRRVFITQRYPTDVPFYLAVESVLRRHFGTVLQYLYNRAHEDHFHLDDGTPVGWNPRSRSRVLYLQAVLTHLHATPVAIDGLYGPATVRATRAVLARLGLSAGQGAGLGDAALWKAFLARNANLGFRLALADDPSSEPDGEPGNGSDAPPVSTLRSPVLASVREQVAVMRATADTQFQRLETLLRRAEQAPPAEVGGTVTPSPDADGVTAPAAPAAPAAPTAPTFRFATRGRMSTFGGPRDTGVAPGEGLALIQPAQAAAFGDLFLQDQPSGTVGLARRLDPAASYLACRWNYAETPKADLRRSLAVVRNPESGAWALARPVDWGPAEWTGRVADLSPGLARTLRLKTDDIVEVELV